MGGALDGTTGYFDWSAALSFVDRDRELLRDVVEAFLDECPRLMQTMRRAIDEGDAPALSRAAHVMASAMRTFGIAGAADAAICIEQLGRANQFADAGPFVVELEAQLDLLIPAAKALLEAAERLD